MFERMSDKAVIKWLAGSSAFFLPALITVAGMRLDKSQYRNDPLYSALIPVAGWSAIILALVIPTVLVLTSRTTLPRRFGFTAVIWCLLLMEFYLCFIIVMSGH
ncbi:MAG: hypothetical protein ACRESK_00050 [Gammaproteobacteria bacterium]